MNTIKGLIIYWILILNSFNALSQNLEETLIFAEKLLVEGRFEQAAKSFKRVLFFDDEHLYDHRSIHGLALSTYEIQDYTTSSKYFQNAFRNTRNVEDFYYHVFSLLALEKYQLAKRSMLTLNDTTQSLKISKNVLLGVINFYLDNFEIAEKHFQEVNAIVDDDGIFLQNILKSNAKAQRKKPITALLLSAFLPGAGQFYSKHHKEGVNSLLLMSAVFYIYYYSITTYGVFDAVLTILPWFQRYYVGGLNMSANLVKDYKDERKTVLYNDLVNYYYPLLE
jgi:tetratricopeptide (TPR) repeat protein